MAGSIVCAYERHPTLYFPLGDIALAALAHPFPDGSAKITIFRVGMHVLAHHSPVFQDMLAFPQPPEYLFSDEHWYDGAPLVHMPDNAEDLASLLHLLYNPFELFDGVPISDLPLVVAPPLRLALKYDMDSLSARLIALVTSQWPTIRSHPPVDDVPFHECVPEPASAIRFAREFGCAEILPAAFYALAAMHADTDDWLGAMNEDTIRSARWDLLDADAWRVLTHGRARLRARAKLLQQDIHHLADATCDSCRAVATEILADAFRRCAGSAEDPLEAVTEMWREEDRRVHLLCRRCHVALRRAIGRKREELWSTLPEVFGLLPAKQAGRC